MCGRFHHRRLLIGHHPRKPAGQSLAGDARIRFKTARLRKTGLGRWTFHEHTLLRRTLYFGIALHALSACARDGDELVVQRTDSAGVEIVFSPGADRILHWQFERVFTIGGADEGPESFFTVSSRLVEADAAGNLFILDPQNSRIVVFNPDGQFLRSMGGSGGGPGEFQSPGSFAVSPDGAVAVFDYGKGGLVRFDGNGEVMDEQPFPLFPTPTATPQRHFSQFRDTTLVSTSTSPMEADSLTQMLLQIVDSDTLVLAELPLPRPEMAMFEKCGGGIMLPPLFAPELAWATQPGKIAVSASVEYSVSLREAGSLTRIVHREIDPMPASHDQAIVHAGEGMRINFGRGPCLIEPAEVVDKRGYAEIVPLIRTVFLSPSGELWVQRLMVDKDAIAPIDVFDAGGAYIGTLERESFSPVVLLPGDRVGVVEKDWSDVERLAVLSIQR